MGDTSAYSFNIASADSVSDFEFFETNAQKKWENDPLTIGGYRIVPFGETNNLPVVLRDILDENNLAEGIMKRQRGLLWGQGPELYKEEISDNKKIRTWVDDKEIKSWLTSWDYESYLLHLIVDYFHSECTFSKIIRNRGPRIGKSGMIHSLDYVSVSRARLEWPEDRMNPKRVIVGDFDDTDHLSFRPYNIFKETDPFKNPISIVFSNMASFARRFYGVPAYYGALNWIKKASSIPRILTALTDNSLNIKWHIISPSSYWEAKDEKLRENCSLQGKKYSLQMLEDLKDETFKKLGNVLAGEKNIGKFFTSEKVMNEFGQMENWEIQPIDQKVKDFIDSQIKIADKADSATTSGLSLHPALSNIMVDGKLASGSEQLYALKLYLATEIEIPERIITKAINTAIRVNFPDKNLKIGFYHDVVQAEENVNSKERVKNAV